MKKLRKILPLLLAVLLLSGCSHTSDFKDIVIPSTEAVTEAPTEITTEAATEPSTEPPASKKLSAEDVFYRCKFTVGDRTTAYSTNIQASLRIGSAGVYVRTELSVDQHVIMADEPARVNVLSHAKTNMMNMEVEQTTQEYYREEGEKLMCYFGVKETGMYGKEDIFLEGRTPYLIIAQYAAYGCPAYLPDNLQLQPELTTVDDREVYVLEYTQPASALFFFQAPGADMEQLEKLEIPVVQYVDAETFEPVELTYTVPEMDSEMVQGILPGGEGMFGEDGESVDVEIQSYVYRLYNLNFEPSEVPPIPEEVLEGIRTTDGYTST